MGQIRNIKTSMSKIDDKIGLKVDDIKEELIFMLVMIRN